MITVKKREENYVSAKDFEVGKIYVLGVEDNIPNKWIYFVYNITDEGALSVVLENGKFFHNLTRKKDPSKFKEVIDFTLEVTI